MPIYASAADGVAEKLNDEANMPAKKKSILEKRLGESEARLKSAVERLAKATKSYAAKDKQRATMAKDNENLGAQLEAMTAERDEVAASVGRFEDQLKELQEQAATQAGEVTQPAAADRAAEGQAMKSAIRDSLDATVQRLEALITGRLKEAG